MGSVESQCRLGETDLVITKYGKEQTKNEQKIKQLKHKTQIAFLRLFLKTVQFATTSELSEYPTNNNKLSHDNGSNIRMNQCLRCDPLIQ